MTIVNPLPPMTVADAERIATAAHAGQVDKAGNPYILHPKYVADDLASDGYDDDVVIAGWLHDVVEDTKITLDDLRAAGASEVTLNAVDAVTRRAGETYMDMIRRAAADEGGRAVKLADNWHNSLESRLAQLSREDAARLRVRYVKARRILFAAE
ncbi:MAG: HD domain-containing protein [Propionicimonas sp.]